jgi:hypothetical protein
MWEQGIQKGIPHVGRAFELYSRSGSHPNAPLYDEDGNPNPKMLHPGGTRERHHPGWFIRKVELMLKRLTHEHQRRVAVRGLIRRVQLHSMGPGGTTPPAGSRSITVPGSISRWNLHLNTAEVEAWHAELDRRGVPR